MNELKNKKILIVDDEPELLKMIENALFKEGFFNIHTAPDFKTAAEIARSHPIALFILDINLPDGNGFMLYNEIRKFSQSPVIFLTARDEAEDKIRGFNLGADDYITKPFLAVELILRIKAILRRTYGTQKSEPDIFIGDIKINFENASVIKNNCEKPLTAKELILIKKLLENKNKIVTNDALCLAAWGEEYYGHENTLMVHIRRLREKIEKNPSKPEYIITSKGLGYKFIVPDKKDRFE